MEGKESHNDREGERNFYNEEGKGFCDNKDDDRQ
jgi:hypothetical protein